MNISSLIVDVRPGALPATDAELRTWPSVQVHNDGNAGKLVVTIETETDAQTTDIFSRIGALEGVMSVALVYHQFESDPDMEVHHGSDAT